jgi:hypothetical protein
VRTDNGAPFTSIVLNRLSTLSVWWMKLGIRPELIAHGAMSKRLSGGGMLAWAEPVMLHQAARSQPGPFIRPGAESLTGQPT